MLQLLGPLASLLGLEASALADQAKRAGYLWAAIGLFALIALVFALVAIHTGLSLWVGPIWAPLIIAGAAAVIALAIYAVARITANIEHRRELERRRSAETTALVTTATITAIPLLLKSPLMRTVGLPIGGALAAYFLLSRTGPADPKSDAES